MSLNHQCSRQRLGCLQIFCSIVTLPCSPAAFERLECNWSRESRTWLTVIPQGYIIGVTVIMRHSLIYASLGQPTGQCDHDWYFLSLLTLNGAFKVGCRTAHPTASSRTPRFAHFKWSDFQSVKNNVIDINECLSDQLQLTQGVWLQRKRSSVLLFKKAMTPMSLILNFMTSETPVSAAKASD